MKNTRYVPDGTIVFTSGVTVAIPPSIALVEAIAGHTRATPFAAEPGVIEWNSTQNSKPFHLNARHLSVFFGQQAGILRHEKVGSSLMMARTKSPSRPLPTPTRTLRFRKHSSFPRPTARFASAAD